MTPQAMKILHSIEPSITHISRNHEHPISHRTLIYHPNRPHLIRLRAEAKGFNTTPDKPLRRKDGGDNAARESSSTKRNGGGGDEEIPDVVQGRIISRILTYVGVPLATGIVLLKVFGAAKQRGLWDVPYWLPILATFITFGASTLGVAYGAISTSWDADREGSLLGFEEAQKNWVDIWREEEEDDD